MENQLFNLNTVLKLRKESLIAIKALKFVLSHYDIIGLESLNDDKIFNFICSIEMISNELMIECRKMYKDYQERRLLEH